MDTFFQGATLALTMELKVGLSPTIIKNPRMVQILTSPLQLLLMLVLVLVLNNKVLEALSLVVSGLILATLINIQSQITLVVSTSSLRVSTARDFLTRVRELHQKQQQRDRARQQENITTTFNNNCNNNNIN